MLRFLPNRLAQACVVYPALFLPFAGVVRSRTLGVLEGGRLDHLELLLSLSLLHLGDRVGHSQSDLRSRVPWRSPSEASTHTWCSAGINISVPEPPPGSLFALCCWCCALSGLWCRRGRKTRPSRAFAYNLSLDLDHRVDHSQSTLRSRVPRRSPSTAFTHAGPQINVSISLFLNPRIKPGS